MCLSAVSVVDSAHVGLGHAVKDPRRVVISSVGQTKERGAYNNESHETCKHLESSCDPDSDPLDPQINDDEYNKGYSYKEGVGSFHANEECKDSLGIIVDNVDCAGDIVELCCY